MNMSEFSLNFRYAFNLRKPLLWFRLAWAVIKAIVFKKSFLRYVDFAIDFACNLKCEHCFATALENKNRRKMDIKDYARVSKEAMKLGAVNFSFQGGEPLLFSELKDIIHACRPYLNVISVTTNGTLLTGEKIRNLKNWGVDILTVSLDSAIAEEHDKFRGMPGAFQKAFEGINRALEAGLKVTLGTVITHSTLKNEGIKKLIELAEKLKVIVMLILPVPAGRWQNNSEIFLDQDDIVYIKNLTEKSKFVRTDFQANLSGYGCGAVKEILYLTPYGDVLACPFIHISLGNIFETALKKIRKKALEIPYFKYYNGKCLASTDKDFIENYLCKTFDAENLPLESSFVFSKDKGN